jgi:predicted metal-dependent peptidase
MSTYQALNPVLKIKKGIIELQKRMPFFGYFSLNLDLVEFPKTCPIQTMGVSADFKLYYSSVFVNETIPDYETLLGCIVHENAHIAFNHIGRTGDRDKQLANVAQDMVVWYITAEAGFRILTGDQYVNVSFKDKTGSCILPIVGKIVIRDIHEKSWERIYDELLEKITKSGSSPEEVMEAMAGSKSYVFDDHMHDSLSKMKPEERDMAMNKIRQAVASAYVQSKDQGNMPGTLERFVKELLKVRIPWQNKIQKYVHKTIEPKDYTYNRPHKRSYNLNLFMPSINKESVEIGIVVDVSGSISQKDCTEFISNVYAILKSCKNVKTHIYFADDKINDKYVLKGTDVNKLLSIKLKDSGGGTDMESVFIEVQKDLKNVKLLICLTDGYTHFSPSNVTKFNIVWCISKAGYSMEKAKERIKYGEIVKIDY